jgi:hypothetical protein
LRASPTYGTVYLTSWKGRPGGQPARRTPYIQRNGKRSRARGTEHAKSNTIQWICWTRATRCPFLSECQPIKGDAQPVFSLPTSAIPYNISLPIFLILMCLGNAVRTHKHPSYAGCERLRGCTRVGSLAIYISRLVRRLRFGGPFVLCGYVWLTGAYGVGAVVETRRAAVFSYARFWLPLRVCPSARIRSHEPVW